MLSKLKTAAQEGDTIVEVMLVLAVLGLALSISYATANRSLLNARQAQESSDAAELVKTQIEALRVLAPLGTSDPSNIFYQASDFCVYDSGGGIYKTQLTAADPLKRCIKQPIGYAISITYCRNSGNPACATLSGDDTFLVKATWDDVLGHGQDTVSIAYRVHKTHGVTLP